MIMHIPRNYQCTLSRSLHVSSRMKGLKTLILYTYTCTEDYQEPPNTLMRSLSKKEETSIKHVTCRGKVALKHWIVMTNIVSLH